MSARDVAKRLSFGTAPFFGHASERGLLSGHGCTRPHGLIRALRRLIEDEDLRRRQRQASLARLQQW